MFLHTLKFKGYIGPRTSFGVYMLSYLATFYSIVMIRGVFVTHAPLVAITAVAMLLNRFGHHLVGDKNRDLPGHAWQLVTLALLFCARAHTQKAAVPGVDAATLARVCDLVLGTAHCAAAA